MLICIRSERQVLQGHGSGDSKRSCNIKICRNSWYFSSLSQTADSIYVKRILILSPSCPRKKIPTKKFPKLFRYLANICYNVRITLARTMLTHHFLFLLTNFVVNREKNNTFFSCWYCGHSKLVYIEFLIRSEKKNH